jgi:hypothetical protein
VPGLRAHASADDRSFRIDYLRSRVARAITLQIV